MKIIKIALTGFACFLIACQSPDSEPPTVQITYPINNSIVGGTVTVTITASDNEVVEQVELLVDGSLAATLDVTPYTYSWATDSLANNSTHTLTAIAYDETGNESLPDTVCVQVFNDTTGISILIWHYDPLDRFYDADIGDSVDCAYWLVQALMSNEHTPEVGNSLPADLSSYDAVFVTLGWFRC